MLTFHWSKQKGRDLLSSSFLQFFWQDIEEPAGSDQGSTCDKNTSILTSGRFSISAQIKKTTAHTTYYSKIQPFALHSGIILRCRIRLRHMWGLLEQTTAEMLYSLERTALEGNPNIPLPSSTIRLSLRHVKVFSGQRRHIILPANFGSTCRSPPNVMCQNKPSEGDTQEAF